MSNDSRTAVVQLDASAARNAHIAARKLGMSRDDPAMKELYRAFGDDPKSAKDMPRGELRFRADAVALCEIAAKAQEHGKIRREKGHSAAQSKYYSVGSKIESQLIRQGEWAEPTEADDA